MAFCPICGAAASEAQRFCANCGASLGVVNSQPSGKRSRPGRLILGSLGICFGLLLLYGLISEQDTLPPTSNPEQNSPQNTPTGEPVSKQSQAHIDEVPAFKIGQAFSIGYWSYVCHGAIWTPALGSDPYSIERANADFVVVDITVRNDDRSSSTLPPFQLSDSEGRTYDESSAGALSQGFFSVLEQLNPGVSQRGRIAFDVPPDRQYFMIFSGGIESGKRASVLLPMPASSGQPPSPNGSQ